MIKPNFEGSSPDDFSSMTNCQYYNSNFKKYRKKPWFEEIYIRHGRDQGILENKIIDKLTQKQENKINDNEINEIVDLISNLDTVCAYEFIRKDLGKLILEKIGKWMKDEKLEVNDLSSIIYLCLTKKINNRTIISVMLDNEEFNDIILNFLQQFLFFCKEKSDDEYYNILGRLISYKNEILNNKNNISIYDKFKNNNKFDNIIDELPKKYKQIISEDN